MKSIESRKNINCVESRNNKLSVESRKIVTCNLSRVEQKKIVEIIESLDELDDVQKIFINVNIELDSL